MVNVVVSRKRNVKVSTNATAGVIDTSVPVTLKNIPTIMTGGAQTVEQLHDVNASQKTDGSTLIYDQPTHTYVVKKLDLNLDVEGSLDGGTF